MAGIRHGTMVVLFRAEVPRRLHGTQERIEFGRPAQRVRMMRAASPSPSPRRFVARTRPLAEYPRLLLLSRSAQLQPSPRPRAIQHADAAAFGFHSGVETKPVC
jgi:hypothetical protein